LEIFVVNSNKKANSNNEEPSPRRKFLTWLGVSLSGLSAVLVGVPVISFVLAPFIGGRREFWRSVGRVDRFKVGTTTEVSFENAQSTPWADGFAKTAAWLQRRSEREFVAYSINCTHLGCPVRWVPESELFMCPCHGGVYYKDGKVAAGPPPHGLVTYPVRIKDGHVQVRTSEVPIT
jgi:menaquinol-cytochrome c reductase iron-sulfur subunit